MDYLKLACRILLVLLGLAIVGLLIWLAPALARP